MVPNFEQLKKDYEIIFICKFGSHLYGTDTPASDTDYKGIYIPSKYVPQLLLRLYTPI